MCHTVIVQNDPRRPLSGASMKPPFPLPTTPRGLRTRSLLLDNARAVFERKGYLDTAVADITEAAGVSHGTFYKYFASKQDVLRVLAIQLQPEMMGERPKAPDGGGDGRPGERSLEEWWHRVESSNRRYLTSYMKNAKMMAIIEQVATFDDEMRALRREIRTAYVYRSERAIARLQAQGLADDDVDARYASNALGAMVDKFAYVWLILGEDFELEESTRTLTLLWARAIGLAEPKSS